MQFYIGFSIYIFLFLRIALTDSNSSLERHRPPTLLLNSKNTILKCTSRHSLNLEVTSTLDPRAPGRKYLLFSEMSGHLKEELEHKATILCLRWAAKRQLRHGWALWPRSLSWLGPSVSGTVSASLTHILCSLQVTPHSGEDLWDTSVPANHTRPHCCVSHSCLNCFLGRLCPGRIQAWAHLLWSVKV